MTSYGAYDAGLPCKNPSCASHGKPHPNCRCYGDYAEGGEVSHFCTEDRKHEQGCEYFAEGGEVEVDPASVEVDAPAEPTTSPMAEVAPENVEVDAPAEPSPEDIEIEEPKPNPGGMPSPEGATAIVQAIEPARDLKMEPGVDYDPETKRLTDAFFRGETPAAKTMADTNETAFGAAALMTGGAGVRQIDKAAKGIAEMAKLGNVGTKFLQGAIASGVIQGGNEVSDWLLGKGDPEHPVGSALAHMGLAALLGGPIYGSMATASSGLKAAAETKVGGKLMGFLAGFASAARDPIGAESRVAADQAIEAMAKAGGGPNGFSMEAYKLGQKAFDKSLNKIPKGITQAIGGWLGHQVGGIPGTIAGGKVADALADPVTNMVEKLVRPSAKKFVAPVTLKILSSGNTKGLLEAIGHAEQIGAGYDAVLKGVGGLMEAGVKAGIQKGAKPLSDTTIKKLDEWVEKGGVNHELQSEIYRQGAPQAPQGFAEGGEVKTPVVNDKPSAIPQNDGVAVHYPEQNMLMSMARGRISNYLTQLRPGANAPKLPFDDEPDQTTQKKSYDKALRIAAKPLSILDEVKRGTLDAEHMRHFNAMHPELKSLITKKMTEEIVKAQVKGKKPPYATRQAMSMFLGTSLSSELTPQNIQAAQAVFQKQKGSQQQQQAPMAKGPKKSLSSLTKSDDAFLTGNQSRTKRMQRPS